MEGARGYCKQKITTAQSFWVAPDFDFFFLGGGTLFPPVLQISHN